MVNNKKITTEDLDNKLKRNEIIINNLKKHIDRIEFKLRSLINKQTSEIRVLEKNGKWSGYTGVFNIIEEDKEKMIINKALEHYEKYFKDVDFYENRTLGLFVTSPEGKELIEVLQDKENNLKQNK